MAKGKGEVKGWITVNGVHVPIYENYSVRGGEEPKSKGSKFKSAGRKKKKVDTSTTSGKTANDLNSNLKKKGLELDSADLSSMAHKDFNDEKVTMYDKDGNTYEGTYNKYKNGDREIVDIKKTGGRDTGKSEVSKGHTEEGKGAVKDVEGKKPVTKEKPKNFKEGLKQHEGIQQIAEAQNEKVWNGGATNQELYDADKFAESKNFNKDKVRDAAFSAFNEKWWATNKARQAQKDTADEAAKKEGFSSAEDRKLFDAREKAYETRGLRGQAEKGAQVQKPRPANFKEGLKQHPDIQRIAEEQNTKVWNGGATNQELYDAADKFSESKNFNKDKVGDAAFSAFNEKWWATNRAKQAEKEQASSTISERAGSANGSIPTTVSGLRSAYSEATGSEKAAIASELRKKGYSLVGGKWVKGR